MSVARSAYRQLLRVGKSVSQKYADPNDMCFALFGILVTREDFINAGYGGDFQQIVRTCFLRPSVTGDAHDSTSVRVSAAFDALRRLNGLDRSSAAFRIREFRQQMKLPVPYMGSSTSAEATAAATTSESGPAEGKEEVTQASTEGSGEAESAEAADEAPTDSEPEQDMRSCLEEGVDLIRGNVLIERSSRRRIQSFPRHCVVCEPVSIAFPPYRFCVPPEPAYLLAVRNEFALHGITDALLALSATSILNAHRQVQLDAGHNRPSAPTVSTTTATASGEDGKSMHEAVSAEAVTPRGFPTTKVELQELVARIPNRTIVQTDVLEVEVTTEYVCSNPSSITGDGVAEAQRQKYGREGAFTSTTPLKEGSAAESAVAGGSATATAEEDSKAHLFLYYVYVRNRGPQKNPKKWHAQVLSHHLVVVDVAQAQVLEMGRPGVMGNFPLLPPGASHCFESGTTLAGTEGVLRGSIQINLFNDAGETMMLDAAIAATRLTVNVTSAHGFTPSKQAKEELVQRTREDIDTETAAGEEDEETEETHARRSGDTSKTE